MNEREISAISEAVAKKIIEGNRDFMVDAETHYNHHHELGELLDALKSAKSTISKAFFRLVILGALFLAYMGIKSVFPHK